MNDNGEDEGGNSEGLLQGRDASRLDDGNIRKQQGGMQGLCDENGPVGRGKLNENGVQEEGELRQHE